MRGCRAEDPGLFHLVLHGERNWDLAGNNTPVFCLLDPLIFTDLNHAVKRDPRTNMRRNHREDEDYFTQPGLLFRLMSPTQQEALFGNTARALGDAPREIKICHINHCMQADLAYGKGVSDALGISRSEIPA